MTCVEKDWVNSQLTVKLGLTLSYKLKSEAEKTIQIRTLKLYNCLRIHEVNNLEAWHH